MGIYNSNYDFNKYKIFYAVAEYLSFSKAAEVLHISQPAISYAIKELETTLNTKLFIRNNKDIKLTDDGEKLMYYVQKALYNIIKAETILSERIEEATGLVRIGVYSHISEIFLPYIIKEFRKLNPNAKFSIYQSSNNELKEKLKHKELDFIILQYPVFINELNIKEEILFELDTCFYATKPTYKKYIENEKETIDLILPFDGYVDIDTLEEKLKRNNINFSCNIRSYGSETIKELVKKDLGIGWGLKKSIENELKNNELYIMPIKLETPKTIFSIAYEEKFVNNTTKEFLNFLKENINRK